MNLTRLSDVRALLATLGVTPNRTLGQNFLIDRNILTILAEAAGVSARDVVLEVGPGLGVVTEELLRAAGRVIAVEKDDRLFAHLAERFRDEPRLCLIHADMLDVRLGALPPPADGLGAVTRVVSNLPYAVGTRILVDLVRAPDPPGQITVTVQEEVAQRMAAAPGTAEHGMLTLWVQLDYEVAIRKRISATCFWPPPEVQSALVVLRRRDQPWGGPEERRLFYALTRHVFMHRRKQLGTLLARAPEEIRLAADPLRDLLAPLGFEPRSRPEDLPLEAWCALARALASGAA